MTTNVNIYDSRNNSIAYPFSTQLSPKEAVKLFCNSPDGIINSTVVNKVDTMSNMALIPITDEWLPTIRRDSGDSSLWAIGRDNKEIQIRPSTGLIIRYSKAMAYFKQYVLRILKSNKTIADNFSNRFPIASDITVLLTNLGIHKSFIIDSETGRFIDGSGFTAAFKALFPASVYHLWNERDFYYQLSKYMKNWDNWALNNFSNDIGRLVALVLPLPDRGLYKYDNKLVTNTYKDLDGHAMSGNGIVSFNNKLYFLAYLGDSIQDGKKIDLKVDADATTKAAEKDVVLKSGGLSMDDLSKMWNSDVVIVPKARSGNSSANNASNPSTATNSSRGSDNSVTPISESEINSIRKVNKFNSAQTPILDWAKKMNDIKNED